MTLKKELALMLIALVAGVVVGYASSYVPSKSIIDYLKSELVESESRVEELGVKIKLLEENLSKSMVERKALERMVSKLNSSLSEALAELEGKKMRVEELVSELNAVREQNRRMAKNYSMIEAELKVKSEMLRLAENKLSKIEKIILSLEKDRKLLIQLRMDVPEEKEEVLRYWRKVKNLSIQLDPSLGPMVDRIIESVDPYFEWVEKQPEVNASLEEWGRWFLDYYVTGANAYGEAIGDFLKEVYLAIINHIRVAVELIS